MTTQPRKFYMSDDRNFPYEYSNPTPPTVKEGVSKEEVLKKHLVNYYRKDFPQPELSDDELYKKVRVFHEEEKAILAAMEEYAAQSCSPTNVRTLS